MEVISFEVKQKRFGWKDWFIQEEAVNTEKLYIWCEKSFIFDIDPSFEIFEVEGTFRGGDPAFIMTYLFTDERMIEKVYCTSYYKQQSDFENNIRHFKGIIKK